MAEKEVEKVSVHIPPDGKAISVTKESAELAAKAGYVEVGKDADKAAKAAAAEKAAAEKNDRAERR